MTKLSRRLELTANGAACWASTRWLRRFGNGGRWGIYPGGAPAPQSDRGLTIDSSAPTPVFITARFRSGSTYLWNIFHQLGGFTAYYEPLHEQRWFESTGPERTVDTTHVETASYHTNYAGLESLAELYDERWTTHRLYMDARATDRELEAYIQALIDRADKQPVLQFNRVDFRLAWLRRHFPHARLLHLYRSPREQWISCLRARGATLPTDITLADIGPMDLFYLKQWWKSLRYVFPGLRSCLTAHPYRAFYMLWRWSYLMGRQFADVSVAYEELAGAPRQIMGETLAGLGLPAADHDWHSVEGMTHFNPEPRWPAFASADWFENIEGSCEEVIDHALRR